MSECCSIEQMHNVHLTLLKELKRVCDNNGLRYYLACGTCLGAVRHQGFIPWDHDADVFMYFSDIEKLASVSSQFNDSFFLQCKSTDPGFDSIIYRLRKSDTTCITKDSIGLDCNQGFAIDIYPLYFYPNNFFAAHLNILRSYIYRVLMADRVPYNHGLALKYGAKILLSLYKGKKRKEKCEQLKNKLCMIPKGKYILTYFGLDISFTKALLYETAWFETPANLSFEGETFSAPTNYDAYLTKKYGDYMQLPPEEKRYADIEKIVVADIAKGYLEYKDVYIVNEEGKTQ